MDDVIPESDLYNIIKNEEDLMILSFFNNLSDGFLLKLYDKLGGKEYLTTQYFFSKYNDRIKELLVKKE
ncbi:MAG TPA: hypothetical protein PK993_06100 [Clostridia bacterium]|nr:hypothetical protein [Clostridia bacterium]